MEAQEPPQNRFHVGNLLVYILIAFPFLGSRKNSSKRPHFVAVLGGALGPPKKCSVAPGGRQDPPKMEQWSPTWASKKSIHRGQVGPHLGRVLATHGRSKINFLRPNLAPCWLHVGPHLGPQDGPHFGIIFDRFLDPFGTTFDRFLIDL